MSWRWRLGEWFGIVVYMHVTFLLLLGWVALVSLGQGLGWVGALEGIVLILLVFACVVLHEYGHALTARRYGIRTRDITLLPIGGVARLERMPRDPVQELWVALAGPAVNVVIAAVLVALILLLRGVPAMVGPGLFGGRPLHEGLLRELLRVNIYLVLFNLIPAFPMDGGRVLRALLARRMDYVQATRAAASVGQLMAFLFAFVGLFYNPFLLFIALFVYMGAEAEAQAVQVQSAFRGLPVRRVMVTRFAALSADEPLSRAVQLLLSSTQQDFPVMEDGRVAGLLTRRALLTGLHDRGPAAAVASVMQTGVAAVEASAPLEETFQRMQMDELPALPVVDQGRLVGMITMENIAEYLMVTAAVEDAPSEPGRAVEQGAAEAEQSAAPEAAAWRRRRGEQI